MDSGNVQLVGNESAAPMAARERGQVVMRRGAVVTCRDALYHRLRVQTSRTTVVAVRDVSSAGDNTNSRAHGECLTSCRRSPRRIAVGRIHGATLHTSRSTGMFLSHHEPKLKRGTAARDAPIPKKQFPSHSARCVRRRTLHGGMTSMLLISLMRSTPPFWINKQSS